jgi:hypothetical protein
MRIKNILYWLGETQILKDAEVPSSSIRAAHCSDISSCWFQHHLHCGTNRHSILSNVCICKHKHNDKLTSQPYTDTCTSCSRQTATFRHVNMLTDCTFLQFLSPLYHPVWSILTGATTLWTSWKVDEETWSVLGQSNWDIHRDANM